MYHRSVTNWTRSTKFKSKRVQIKIRVYAFERVLRFYLLTRFTVTVHTQKLKLITASTMYISVFCVFCNKTCLDDSFRLETCFFCYSSLLLQRGFCLYWKRLKSCVSPPVWFSLPSFFLFDGISGVGYTKSLIFICCYCNIKLLQNLMLLTPISDYWYYF